MNESSIRKMFHEQMNQGFVHLSYKRVREIMYNDMPQIDIYGDNSLPKHIEHVFPQSHFKDSQHRVRMKSELHNLYLCNYKLNMQRKNYRYVDHSTYVQTCNDHILDQLGETVKVKDLFRKTGYMMLINHRKKVFVPTIQSRGMIARSLAYFAIKYDMIDELKNIIDIRTLIEWSCAEPVSAIEFQKNVICYKYQNCHNPFILYPNMLPYVFADFYVSPCKLTLNVITVPPDPIPSIEMLVENISCLEAENTRLSKQVKRLQAELKKCKS